MMKEVIQQLVVLTSPPASGKTYWIEKYHNALGRPTILVISPLRALADECRRMWPDSILIMTPEEWLGKKIFAEIVIIDEFHLFFYWGDSFRPLMWEMFFEVTTLAQLTLLLSATLSHEMREEIKLFSTQFDQMYWSDHGNQKLKYSPAKYLKCPNKKWILSQIEVSPKNKEVKLIFCEYRNEVLDLEKKLIKLGFSCVSCIGGEAKMMAGKLEENPRPDFIIATTVLSHGVNLPSIKKVYFLYKVQNLDFWTQMVARGGRRGEAYEVYSLEKPFGMKWKPLKNTIRIIYYGLRHWILSQSFPFWNNVDKMGHDI